MRFSFIDVRFIVCAALLVGFSAYGKTHKSEGTATTRGRSVPLYLTVAPSIAIIESTGLPGLNLQLALCPVRDLPLYLTGDTGPYFYTGYSFQVMVPILLGMDYHIPIPDSKVRPLFGVALGPVIGSRVVFGMLFRPGVIFDLHKNISLNLELRLGVIASSFAFVPQFGVRFVL